MAKEKELVEIDGVELEYEPNPNGCKINVDPVTQSLDGIDISRELEILDAYAKKERKVLPNGLST